MTNAKELAFYALSAVTIAAGGWQLVSPSEEAKAGGCCIDDWDCGNPFRLYCDKDSVAFDCAVPITYECQVY